MVGTYKKYNTVLLFSIVFLIFNLIIIITKLVGIDKNIQKYHIIKIIYYIIIIAMLKIFLNNEST